ELHDGSRTTRRHSRKVKDQTRNLARIISRFRVRANARPGMTERSPLGVAGPGADYAFLAAEFVALFGRGVERARYFRLHGVTMRAAGIGHVDGECGTGALHGHSGAIALALFQGSCPRGGLGGIVIGLA